jgi:hypothetical protein
MGRILDFYDDAVSDSQHVVTDRTLDVNALVMRGAGIRVA